MTKLSTHAKRMAQLTKEREAFVEQITKINEKLKGQFDQMNAKQAALEEKLRGQRMNIMLKSIEAATHALPPGAGVDKLTQTADEIFSFVWIDPVYPEDIPVEQINIGEGASDDEAN